MLHQRVNDAAAALAAGQVQWRVAFLLTNRIVVLLKNAKALVGRRTKRSRNASTMEPRGRIARFWHCVSELCVKI